MEKKKVLILGHGGTIVMKPSKHGKTLVPADQNYIMDMVPSLREMADVTFLPLVNIDSTNVNPTHWTALTFALSKEISNYDAIIVTHGTDTMAYTSGAVSIALGRGFKIPIVFTGSQLPLVSYGSDARFNLENAMKVALQASEERIEEVMIVFANRILRASRGIKTSESDFTAFGSPALDPLGTIDATGVHFSPNVFHVDEKIILDIKPQFHKGILSLELVPGFDPGILFSILDSGKCAGLLLKSLGAGNVPDAGEYSIIPAIKEAVNSYKIPVIVSTKFVGGNTHMDLYGPGQAALDAGAIPTGNMTDVMSQVKLMWCLVNGYHTREALLKIMNISLVGEVTPV